MLLQIILREIFIGLANIRIQDETYILYYL